MVERKWIRRVFSDTGGRSATPAFSSNSEPFPEIGSQLVAVVLDSEETKSWDLLGAGGREGTGGGSVHLKVLFGP